MNMMTVIFLATLFYVQTPEVKENLYSWQIQFSSYEQCEQFFDIYGDKLLNGVVNHGKLVYGQDLGVEYLACAEVKIDPTQQRPQIVGQKVVYEKQ